MRRLKRHYFSEERAIKSARKFGKQGGVTPKLHERGPEYLLLPPKKKQYNIEIFRSSQVYLLKNTALKEVNKTMKWPFMGSRASNFRPPPFLHPC